MYVVCAITCARAFFVSLGFAIWGAVYLDERSRQTIRIGTLEEDCVHAGSSHQHDHIIPSTIERVSGADAPHHEGRA